MSHLSSHTNSVPPGGNEPGETSSSTLNQIQLRWTSHQPTIFSIFQKLYNSENLVDVTLAAEGKYLRAHKIILSACSPYFQELLSVDCSTKHPILFMSSEVKFKELKAVLNYMYKGETHIHHEDLPSLLRLAESLQIRGLAETDDTDSNDTNAPPPAPPVPSSQQLQESFVDPLRCSTPTADPEEIIIESQLSASSNPVRLASTKSFNRQQLQQQPLPARSTSTSSPTGGKHKLSSGSTFSQQSHLISDPISFPSLANPIDVSTSHSFKRLRRDPPVPQIASTSSTNIIQPILMSDQLQHHSVNVMTEIPTTSRHPITTLSFETTQGFNERQGQGQNMRSVNVTQTQLADERNLTQYGEVEHVEIISHGEIKVEEVDGLGSRDIGLMDESNSSHLVGDQSVGDDFEDDGDGDEQNNWNMFESVEGGGHSEFGVPFPSTSSSSMQDPSDPGPEDMFNPMRRGRFNRPRKEVNAHLYFRGKEALDAYDGPELISRDQIESAKESAGKCATSFIRSLMRTAFTEDEILGRSLYGRNCNANKDAAVKPSICPIRRGTIIAETLKEYYHEDERGSKTQKPLLTQILKTMRDLIQGVHKKYKYK